MLRPATPLSVLFLAAFVLLLLSTLSTPIIKGIPLATVRGVRFGTFGYCDGDGRNCKGPMIGYDTDNLYSEIPDNEFSLPSATRHSLSSILIVHPVAALMTLVCFGLAVAAHFHSPAHSPRYLLVLLILTFPTLLVSLLAFLVDILLFVPHLAWGGWIVLAATIIIVASGVVTCAMRRTLVSRKARKRRIAENAEMNGQNYYTNRNATNRDANATVVETLPRAESPPPMSGDAVPNRAQQAEFAAFHLHDTGTGLQDDTIPLNTRNPSLNTNSSAHTDDANKFSNPMRAPSGRRQPVDQYGNQIPLAPNNIYDIQDVPRPGPPPGRGRPYGRGRGGPPPRGYGYRGGYGPPRGGPRGQPPPGWIPPGGAHPGPGIPGRGAPPPGYSNNPQAQRFPGHEASPYDPRSLSPPTQQRIPPGQAIEMDTRNGVNRGFGLRESDGDVQGMLALQQSGFPAQAPQRSRSAELRSPTSEYSAPDESRPNASNEAWNSNSNQTLPTTNATTGRGLAPVQDLGLPTNSNERPSDSYYEDVDPRFAEPLKNQPTSLPTALIPGVTNSNPNNSDFALNTTDPNLLHNSSYDNDGSRSPAASDASHFTSVSQRGINPNWRPSPGPPMPLSYGPTGPRRPMRQEDVILEANAANPDFAIRGRGGGRGRGGRGGAVPLNNGFGAGRYPGTGAI